MKKKRPKRIPFGIKLPKVEICAANWLDVSGFGRAGSRFGRFGFFPFFRENPTSVAYSTPELSLA